MRENRLGRGRTKREGPRPDPTLAAMEYQALRREIEQTKARIFQILVGGTTIVPAAQFIGVTYSIAPIMLVLPFFVVIVTLLFLSENNSLMRCGRYIRMCIEPKCRGHMGWETWLELPDDFDSRAVDRYVLWAFYLLSGIYYGVSSFLAVRYAQGEYGVIALAVTVSIYVPLGIWLAISMVKRGLISTRLRSEI